MLGEFAFTIHRKEQHGPSGKTIGLQGLSSSRAGRKGIFMKFVLLIAALIAAYILSQWGVIMITKSVCRRIIKDLDSKRAYAADSAVSLPYAQKKGLLHIGTRDYKPQALQYLVHKGIVCATDDGRFYLDAAKSQDTIRL